ncbi:MAG: hypothetical protein ACT4OS_05020 [Acidimicrobiales bacterium]
MTRGERFLLRSNVLWTAFIWLFFIRNLAGDANRSTGFKVVHFAIAGVSLAFAGALWAATVRSRRRSALSR